MTGSSRCADPRLELSVESVGAGTEAIMRSPAGMFVDRRGNVRSHGDEVEGSTA